MNLFKFKRITTIFLLILLSNTANANILQADAAYENEQYAQALTQYQAAAKVGQARAMHTLGLMYYHGQGMEAPDYVKSTYWYKRAAEFDFFDAQEIYQSLKVRLSSNQRKALELLVKETDAQESKAAIQANILPNLIPDNLSNRIQFSDQDTLLNNINDDLGFTEDLFTSADQFNMDAFQALSLDTSDSFDAAYYSMRFPGVEHGSGFGLGIDFSRHGSLMDKPFYLVADIVIHPDGTVRDIEVIQSFGYIHRGLRRLRETRYATPHFDGTPVLLHKRIELGLARFNLSRFRLADNYPYVYRGINRVLKNAKQDPSAFNQYKKAVALLNFSGLWRQDNEVENLLKSAAEQGLAEAQYVLSNHWIKKQTHIEDAMKWLQISAQQGLVNAEYKLADMILNSPWVEKDEAKALFWYEKAAAQTHVFGLRKAAELKLTAKDKTLRDPKSALYQLEKIYEFEKSNPEYLFLLASAWEQQADRNRKLAVKYLKKAIFRAKQLGWDTEKWDAILDVWTSGGQVEIID